MLYIYDIYNQLYLPKQNDILRFPSFSKNTCHCYTKRKLVYSITDQKKKKPYHR